MLPLELKTPREVQGEIAGRFRAKRLAANLTQKGLAARSGVSLGTLKRFERTGFVALDTLLRLALVLGCLRDFDAVGREACPDLATASLDTLLAKPKSRQKGRIT